MKQLSKRWQNHKVKGESEMMTKKKRMTIFIAVAVLIVLFLVAAFVLLYIKTDMFKSSKSLFIKYMEKNLSNIQEIERTMTGSIYDDSLQGSPYTTTTSIKVSYLQGKGSSEENSQNVINQLNLTIEGQNDPNSQYHYQNAKLTNNGEQAMQVEYLQNGNTYGIRFSDLFNQFLLAENNNLQDLLKKMGYTDEQIANVPNVIDFESEKNSLMFTDEELANLQEKYVQTFLSTISSQNFSSKKNQVIQINNKNVSTNAYTLQMSKEQLNNMYINILEELKNDQAVLTKLDNLQQILTMYDTLLNNTISNNIFATNIKDQFVSNIDDRINSIKANNIGQDSTYISVYINYKKTVRLEIKTSDYVITFDNFIQNDNNKFHEIKMDSGTQTNENTKTLTLSKSNGTTGIYYVNTVGNSTTSKSIESTENAQNNGITRSIVAKYEDSSNKIEAHIDQTAQKVSSLQNQINLDDQNSIKLNNLSDEQMNQLITKVKEGLTAKQEELSSKINPDEVLQAFRAAGIVKSSNTIVAGGITSAEKNRFNSQLELLKAENVDKDKATLTLDTIKNNLINFEVASGNVLKLEVDRNNHNDEVYQKLSDFIKNLKANKFNISLEYDDETGLVKYVVLTIVEDD